MKKELKQWKLVGRKPTKRKNDDSMIVFYLSIQ